MMTEAEQMMPEKIWNKTYVVKARKIYLLTEKN